NRCSRDGRSSTKSSIPLSARGQPAAPTRSRLPARPKPDQTGWAGSPSPVDLSEHDVERAEDGGDVGEQMAFADVVHRLQMRKARRADLALVRLVGAVGDEIDAKLTLGGFDRGIDLAGRHVNTFGVELEVMDQRFHRALHLAAARWRDLVVLDDNRPLPFGFAKLLDALLHDAHGLAHLFHADAVAIVAVAILADRDVEI